MKIVIRTILLVALTGLISALIITYPLKWAVNYLIAPNILTVLFGVAKLNFWRAFCLSLVANSLFKSTVTTKG